MVHSLAIFLFLFAFAFNAQSNQPPAVQDSSFTVEYERLLAQANKNFRNHNCNKATELYNRVLELSPDDSLALARIDWCERRAPEHYYLLSFADDKFRRGEYKGALDMYHRANRIWPNGPYVKAQIKICEEKLREE